MASLQKLDAIFMYNPQLAYFTVLSVTLQVKQLEIHKVIVDDKQVTDDKSNFH